MLRKYHKVISASYSKIYLLNHSYIAKRLTWWDRRISIRNVSAALKRGKFERETVVTVSFYICHHSYCMTAQAH